MGLDTGMIAKHLASGDLSSAKESIRAELDKRKEEAKTSVKEELVSSMFCESVLKKNTSLGEVTIDSDKGTAKLKVGNASGEELLKLAADFAAFVDGLSKHNYSAKLEGNSTVVIYSGGGSLYDLALGGGYLVFSGDFKTSDVDYFKKNSKLPKF